MTDQWQRGSGRHRGLIALMGLMTIFLISATANIAALGQDEKNYHEDREGHQIKAVPAISKGWISEVQRLNRAAQGDSVDVYFLGDSLTQFWQNQGQAVWALDYAPLNAGNFGIAADRVENILWRLQHGNLGDLQPKVFVLMMGTNNLAARPADPPLKVVRGIVQVLTLITTACPSADVLLLSILPGGDDPRSKLRENIASTNRLLSHACAGLSAVEFIDVHDDFLDHDGRWRPGLTLDGTHLSARGYDVLSNRLRPVLARTLKARSTAKEEP